MNGTLLPPFCPVTIRIPGDGWIYGQEGRIRETDRTILDEVKWYSDHFIIERNDWVPWMKWALAHCTHFGEAIAYSPSITAIESIPPGLRRRCWSVWPGGCAFGVEHSAGPLWNGGRGGFISAKLKPEHEHWKTNSRLFSACAVELSERESASRRDEVIIKDGRLEFELAEFHHAIHRFTPFELSLASFQGMPLSALVVERIQRDRFRKILESGLRVSQEVRDEFERACRDYSSARAPLRPLPPELRLGYLDEADEIVCTKAVGRFVPGKAYPVEVIPCTWSRPVEDETITGLRFMAIRSGSDLAVDVAGVLFVPPNLMLEGTSVTPRPQESLQVLVDHFAIPEVPDIASTQRETFNRNLELLDVIERATSHEETQAIFQAKA